MTDQNKSEKPTPRRREKAREQGQVARSRDLSSTLALCGVLGLVGLQSHTALVSWHTLFRNTLDLATEDRLGVTGPLFVWSGWTIAKCVVPVMAIAWVFAVAGGVAQGGVVLATEALIPKMNRISPAAKMQQMFSLTGLSGLLKSLFPFAAIVFVGVFALENSWPQLVLSSSVDLNSYARFLTGVVTGVFWKSSLVLMVWAAVDYLLTWRKVEGDLKMTREELRQESKETDGNPFTKARIRRLQRQMRRQHMLRETERATVVVTNPTHFAIALIYEPDMEAPVVLAKGKDLLAQRMKDVARWKSIPVLENPPLAQALYRTVEVGQAIPAKLYTAVAEVLAFVFRLQNQTRQEEMRRRGGKKVEHGRSK